MTSPTPNPVALADLLRRATAGESVALAELLQRYERRVRLAARSLLRPPLQNLLDSFDLVQSVHRALLPGLRDGRYAFADEEQLVALAVTVLRHKVRRTARRASHPAAAGGRTPPAPADQPADVVAARDLLGRLLDTLDADDRRIVEMRLGGHSTPETAAALNCTPAVLRARLSRLRSRLRAAGWEGGL